MASRSIVSNVPVAPRDKPIAPYKAQSNPAYSLMMKNWKLRPTDNTGMFKGAYDDIMNKMLGINFGVGGPGGAGMGMFDVGNKGLGLYGSDVLNQLAGQVSSDLSNPYGGSEYAVAMDRLAAQNQGQNQALADQYAGWGRGAGIAQAARNALARQQAMQGADTARTTAIEAKRNAMANAFGLENMRGGFFENSKGRELQNAGLGLQAFEGAKGREL